MKKKKKLNVIFGKKALVFTISPEMFVRGIKKKNQLDAGCKAQAKEIVKHFKTDGWDLSLNHYVEEILTPILGRNAQDYIRAKLLQLVTKKYPKASIRYKESFSSPLISKRGKSK